MSIEANYYLKIEFKDKETALSKYNVFKYINKIDKNDTTKEVTKILSAILSTPDQEQISHIRDMEFSISNKNAFLKVYTYGFDLEIEYLTDLIAKYLYDETILSIFKLRYDFDDPDYIISKFSGTKFEIIYYTGASSSYVDSFNDLIFNLETSEEILNKIVDLYKEGKIVDKVNSKDDYVNACGDDSIDPAMYLWNYNDVNFLSSEGETPLTMAIKANNTEVIFMLFEHMEVDKELANAKGELPKDLALATKNTSIIEYFR